MAETDRILIARSNIQEPHGNDAEEDKQKDEERSKAKTMQSVSSKRLRHSKTHKTIGVRINLRRCFYKSFKAKEIDGKRICVFHFVFLLFMLLRIVKTGFITWQMIEFGGHRRYFQELVNSGYTAIEHLLLQDWSSDKETLPYPPSSGPYAIYRRQHLIQHINFAVENYYNFENESTGVNPFSPSLTICVTYFEFDKIPPDEGTSVKQPVIKDPCFIAGKHSNESYDIEKDLVRNNISSGAAFNSFLFIRLGFKLNSLRLGPDLTRGQCLQIDANISFTDNKNSGQGIVELHTITTQIKCRRIGIDLMDVCLLSNIETILWTVLVIACLSAIFVLAEFSTTCCIVWKKIPKKMKDAKQNQTIVFPCKISLIGKKWHLLVQLIGDILIIYANSLMLFRYTEHQCDLKGEGDGEERLLGLDKLAILMACGCWLSWITLTPYLNFHQRFSLLFKTLDRAAFSVLTYIGSLAILFVGFALCGFVMFGPYHIKSMNYTMGTLLSIINGDEIFATWANLEEDKAGNEEMVYWFHTIFIFLYVGIFTVVAFNILIAIFNNAYDVIQEQYNERYNIPVRKNSSVSPADENLTAKEATIDDWDSFMVEEEKDSEVFYTCNCNGYSMCKLFYCLCIFPFKKCSNATSPSIQAANPESVTRV